MTGDQIARSTTHSLHRQLDLDFALQATGLGVWEYNAQSGLVNWDAQCQALFGISAQRTMPYELAIQFIHPQDVQRVDQAVQRALNPDSGGYYDQTYRTIGVDDGRLRWVRFQGRAYFGPSAEIYRFGGVAQEVTQQVAQQQALAESENRFRSLIEEAPVATALFVGRQQRIEVANPPMLAIWGKGDTVLGEPLAAALPELVGQPFLAILDQVFTTGNAYHAQAARADLVVNGVLGTYYFDFTYKPLLDASGQVYGIIDMATDVTQQVLAQQQIDEAQEQILASFEQSPVAIALIEGPALTFRRVNPYYARLTGRSADQLIGRPLLEALPEVAGQGFDRLLRQVMSSRQAVTANNTAVHVNYQGQPHTIYVDFTYQPRRRTDGRITGVLVIATEVTEQVRARQQLEQLQTQLESLVEQRTRELTLANEDLTRSNDNLQQFAYVASHDLQEPLRKIQAFSTLLEQQFAGQLPPLSAEYLQRITAAGARMSTLIKDLLAYSRIATRQQAFGPVSLSAIIESVLSTLDWEIERTEAQVEVDALPVVNGDESQLSQLFQNLLANALKFVAPGQAPHIHIQYVHRSLADLPSEVRPNAKVPFYHQISVVDQGVGFDTKFLDRIFQVFQRLHGKNAYAGSGVGLAIVQRVVENHRGGVTANSKPGEGATFCVYLPA